jgi:thiamine biosynthesis protein ThiI
MRFVSLISSGIDSPVATYLSAKKSTSLILIHADGQPYTDNREINNFISIAKCLKNQIKIEIRAFLIPHGENLRIYQQKCDKKYTCVFCKRMLVRYADSILLKNNAKAIIMGDSLGQVASQTLYNIKVIDQAIKTPILRPLIGLDKENIIKIAKKIGTFNLSILPKENCSAVPSKPSTKCKLINILNEETKININKLVEYSTNNVKEVII